MNHLIEYLLFIGTGLYFLSGSMFFYLFARTLRTKDGMGLLFLRAVTLGISFGSFTIFVVRVLSEHEIISFQAARAIAIVNPFILIFLAFYLNYLFHQKEIKPQLEQKMSDIKKDTAVIKKDTAVIKGNVDILKKKVVKNDKKIASKVS